MVRIGVVGAGGHSTRAHGPSLADCREACDFDVDLRAVCDRDLERAEEYADRFGFESTYREVDELYASESLDAVVAVTPVAATREIAGDLLRRRVPVVIEKPPGRTPAETRELRDIAARAGTAHAVSFNRRFNPALRRAREWLSATVPDRPPTLAVARMLRTERIEESFLTGTGIHAADAVCALLGTPREVSAERWRSRESGGECGECCAARAGFGDATGEFVLVPDAGTHAETYELFGPDYRVRIEVDETALTVSAGGEDVLSWRAPDEAPSHVRNGAFAETRAFLEAVRGSGGFAPTLDDVLPSVRLAAAIDAGGEHVFE